MADKRYTLAHPLDEGNAFIKDGKAAEAGATVPLNVNAAATLASAGYLALDADGKPAEAQAAK